MKDIYQTSELTLREYIINSMQEIGGEILNLYITHSSSYIEIKGEGINLNWRWFIINSGLKYKSGELDNNFSLVLDLPKTLTEIRREPYYTKYKEEDVRLEQVYQEQLEIWYRDTPEHIVKLEQEYEDILNNGLEITISMLGEELTYHISEEDLRGCDYEYDAITSYVYEYLYEKYKEPLEEYQGSKPRKRKNTLSDGRFKIQ